jgi:hypothetical protein
LISKVEKLSTNRSKTVEEHGQDESEEDWEVVANVEIKVKARPSVLKSKNPPTMKQTVDGNKMIERTENKKKGSSVSTCL